MPGFTFQTVPTIISEPGSTARLGALVRERGADRALIVTDHGLLRLGLLDAGLAGLGEAGVTVGVFADVEADPSEATILAATAQARAEGVGAVIGFGGGSPMDVAKLVALLACSDEKLADLYGVEKVKGRRLPLIQVPTTAGTGSEVSPVAVATTGDTAKMGVWSAVLYADVAVLDADLTLGLPKGVTAATGIDAMVHALEAYTSKIRKNTLSDALAREALALLGANIRRVCTDGRDREARAAMLLGSLLAGMAFANAPCAAVHALAYPIGAHFHVAHGLSNSLVLPHVMRFNAPAAQRLYAEVAPLAMPGLRGGDERTLSDGLVAGFETLIGDLGIESRLRQVGVSHNQLPMLAAEAMHQTRLLMNNPREVTEADALAIYQQAW
ncbi:MAG: iron-containing alcohol dehydrogenase [Alphaproteobacteria bacterium]